VQLLVQQVHNKCDNDALVVLITSPTLWIFCRTNPQQIKVVEFRLKRANSRLPCPAVTCDLTFRKAALRSFLAYDTVNKN